MSDFFQKRDGFILLILLLALIYFPIFLHLDYMPFRIWDESILGVNAIEMAHNHNYLVTYFFGKPDMCNCKPPLMIWCIVLFSKVLGFNELSARLPSALAALALCVYLFFILKKITGNYVFGFLTVCILITCQGFIRNHVTRTGEYDSLLVLFSTVFSLSLFVAVEAEDKKVQSKYLFLFFVFLTLGVLTKGVACMMQAPGIFVYVLWRKKAIPFLKSRAFYMGFLFFLFFGLGYYFLRESVNPGYLRAVWMNELGGRFNGLDGHGGPFTMYINEIITWQFVNYMFLFPFACVAGVYFSDSRIGRLAGYSMIVGLSFLIIISSAGTKLPHYDAPLFPYLAIITASLFFMLYDLIGEKLKEKRSVFASGLLAFTCVLALLAKPYYDIIEKVYFPQGDYWEESFSVSCRFFQLAARSPARAFPTKLVMENKTGYGTGTVLACYKEELQQHGIDINFVKREELVPNDRVVVFDAYTRQLIEQDYDIEFQQAIDRCGAEVILIKSGKIKS